MTPELERVDHVHVFVSDRTAAERWYARVLGLERIDALAFWAPEGGPLTLGNASGSIHLALFERPPAGKCRSTIALATSADGLLAWQRHLGAELGKALAGCASEEERIAVRQQLSDLEQKIALRLEALRIHGSL